jgi:hypothetical protein
LFTRLSPGSRSDVDCDINNNNHNLFLLFLKKYGSVLPNKKLKTCIVFKKPHNEPNNSGIAPGLRVGRSGVEVPAGAGNFSPHHRIQTGSGAHPASYVMDSGSSFPGGKAAGA